MMSNVKAYSPDYYSIDDILATQERVPCKFIQVVPKMGRLNSAAEDNDLKPGTALELPLWLALDISGRRQSIINPDLPKIFKEAYREILKADPCAVDLHKWNLYFYEFGSYAKHFDPRGEVSEVLVNTFQLRFRQLMDLADNTISDPMVQQKLDKLERTLFAVGNDSRTKLNTWLMQSGAKIEPAHMVVNHKKRRRVEESSDLL